MFSGSDEDLHKIMDINKVFPKPPEVEEEMRRQKEEDLIRAEQEELARVKALAPVLVPPTMSQLMAAQIGLKQLEKSSNSKKSLQGHLEILPFAYMSSFYKI